MSCQTMLLTMTSTVPQRRGLSVSLPRLNRYVTDEQRSRRPVLKATLRAAASWLFFCVARSLGISQDMLVARALKNSQLTCGDITIICETVHYQPSGENARKLA